MKISIGGKILNGIIFLICSSSIPLQLDAQTKDFFGTWTLRERISLSGVDYENGLAKQLKVVQKNDSIIIERLNVNSEGQDYTINESMSVDGSPAIIFRSGNRKRTSAIKWSDDQRSFMETVNYYKPNSESEVDFTFTELWNFTESNNTLTIEKSQKGSNGDKWSMKGIYEKGTKEQMELRGKGIEFLQSSDWDQAKAKAKKENKYIFVDCYASWCVPCKKMEAEVFDLNIIGDNMNDKFISVRVQMDTTRKDNQEVQNWYATAHNFLNEYNITGYPTFLFFDPNGNIVHKALGTFKPDEFLSLLKKSQDPGRQFYTLLDNYRQGKNKYQYADYLALTGKDIGEIKLAEEILKDYKDNFLNKLSLDSLLAEKYLTVLNAFQSSLIWGDGTRGIFFKLLYQKDKQVDDRLNQPGFSAFHVNGLITKEQIESKIYLQGKPVSNPDWQKIKSAIKRKYSKVDADKLVLSAQIVYAQRKKDGKNLVGYVVEKVEKYGSLSLGQSDGSGSDNTISNALLPHCDDKKILTKAIGWIEEIIRSDAYAYPIPMVYGNYGGILYKAGRRKEGIVCFEKHLNAIGYKTPADMDKDPRFKPKLEILNKMKQGEKIDSTWNPADFN